MIKGVCRVIRLYIGNSKEYNPMYQHTNIILRLYLAIFHLYNLHNRYNDNVGDKEEDGDEDMGSRKVTSKCILLQNFILLLFFCSCD